MFSEDRKRTQCPSVIRLPVVAIGIMVWVVHTAPAQDPTLTAPPSALAPPSSESLTGGWASATAPNAGTGRWQLGDDLTRELGSASAAEKPVRSDRMRRITLEQVKQQRSVDPVASPIARLGQLAIEAAKQHRLGVEADYFPKLGSMFANLHYSEFLGQVLSIRRPIEGSLLQVPIPLFSRIKPSPLLRSLSQSHRSFRSIKRSGLLVQTNVSPWRRPELLSRGMLRTSR